MPSLMGYGLSVSLFTLIIIVDNGLGYINTNLYHILKLIFLELKVYDAGVGKMWIKDETASVFGSRVYSCLILCV